MNTNESTSIITCDECGAIIEGEVCETGSGETLCLECAERLGLIRCDRCGKWYDPSEEDMAEYDDQFFCEDCAHDLSLTQCDECGEWYRERDLAFVNGGWRRGDYYLCESCLETALEREDVFFCDDCNEYYRSDEHNMYYTHDGSTVCGSCRADHYGLCEDCGELFYTDDLVWNDDDDCAYCESCNENHQHYSGIHDYGYRPAPVFHGINHTPRFGDPLTIGFELEVDNGDDEDACAEAITDAFDDDTLYLKDDGSVSFEIVTHPHTLKAYMTELDLDELCSIPGEYGFSSHTAGTCGLHMHVGRAQLGDTRDDQFKVISRIVLLMYRHWDSLVKFSRRRDSQLDRWARKPQLSFDTNNVRYDEDKLESAVRSYYSCIGRYQALNLEPRGTIEFRLWRGSLNPNTVRATLQLTHNIVRYCMEHTFEDVVNSKWTDITGYETIPALDAYLVERDLVDGYAVNSIPYNNDVVIPTPTEDDLLYTKYRVGDKVEIVNSDGTLVHPTMVGVRGTIGDIRNHGRNDTRCLILVDLDSANIIQSTHLHSANGRAPEHNGYWAYEGNLAFTEDVQELNSFRVGDRVRLSNEHDLPGLRMGTVAIITDGDIGVRFDGFSAGHGLGLDSYDHSGWWVFPEDLVHVA